MMKQIISLLQGFLVIAIAPLFIGWTKKVKCWFQQRSAPKLLQPYGTIYKLLIKEPVLSNNASWLFRFSPYIYFTALATICFNLPFFMTDTLSSRSMDFIVLVGLLTLSRILLALAAMDVGTAFGDLGARREMMIACLTEPVLLVVLYNITLLTHSSYLSGSVSFLLQHNIFYPSLVFSCVALLLVLIAETGRVPIDNPATHLELTMIHEAMVLEYSGRYLALIEWGNAIKFILYLTFITSLFFPIGLSTNYQLSFLITSILIMLLKLFFLSGLIVLIESINSKLRIFKVPDYLASAFMLSILGVIITQLLGASL